MGSGAARSSAGRGTAEIAELEDLLEASRAGSATRLPAPIGPAREAPPKNDWKNSLKPPRSSGLTRRYSQRVPPGAPPKPAQSVAPPPKPAC